MNAPGPKRIKSPLQRGPPIPRGLSKRLRRSLVSLQFALRRPPKLALCLSLLASFLVLLLLFFSTGGFVSAKFSGPHAILSFAHRRHAPDSALSPEACDRKYDQAWQVARDDGREAVKKEVVEIAYFVQVGADSVHLLPRLFARIHHPRNVYVVHVDAKVEEIRRRVVEELVSDSEVYSKNVHVMKSEMITYKAISMVLNTLAAMTIALEKHATWDYFINLSGADYPLVGPEEQARLLSRPKVPNGRLNFVSFFPRKEWKPYSFRIRNMHWDPAAVGYQSSKSQLHLLRGQKTNPLEKHRGFVFTKAEAWMILSRPFVTFVLRSGFAKRMLMNHVHVLSVAEHYFADVLYNHPFWKTTIVPDGMRRVVWYLKHRRSGQHPYVLDTGTGPFAFWEYISETKSLFARKFSEADHPMMDRVDREMNGHGMNVKDEFAEDRKVFYRRIVDHFDDLTKKTLALQRYSYPRAAYPNL